MDLDDMFSESVANVRARGRFQPKVKPRPKNVPSSSTASTPPTVKKEKDVQICLPTIGKVPSAGSVKVIDNGLAASKVTLPAQALETDSKEDNCSSFGNESDPAKLCFDPSMDLPDPAINNARAGGEFQPKAKPVPDVTVENSFTSAAVGSGQTWSVKSVDTRDSCGAILSDFGDSTMENADGFFDSECLEDIYTMSTDETRADQSKPHEIDMHTQIRPEMPMSSPVNCSIGVSCFSEETPILSACTNKILEKQEAKSLNDMETLNIISVESNQSGWHTGKLQPVSKLRSKMPAREQTLIRSPNSHFVAAEAECIDEGSVPGFLAGDVSDYSSMSAADAPPDSITSELPVDIELTKGAFNPSAEHTVGNTLHSEVFLEVPEELDTSTKGKASRSSAAAHKRKSSSSIINDNVLDRPPRRLKKGVAGPVLVDEPDGLDESPSDSTVNLNEDIEEATPVKSKSQKKSVPDKSKEKEKPNRKRKNAHEPPDKPTKAPSKRFPHGTRRKKRQVNKELLDTPEDEIRYLPIKDMLMITDHYERLTRKETQKPGGPSTNQSTENTFRGQDFSNEEETMGSESMDEPTSTVRNDENFILNYHSFMKKEPRSKWSMKDTELFYEAVQQFGSDLSMIQQLFPDKTRHQIKLKYKQEERKQPMKLFDALGTRTKDHSHFVKVIERLQQLAVEAEYESNEEETETADKESVETTKANGEEAANSEGGKEVQINGTDTDTGVGTSLKSEGTDNDKEDDEEDDIWNTYTSEY